MAKARDRNFVSFWFWLLSMVVLAIPLLNVVMTLLWAFTGDNETRKNYFKAIIVFFCLTVAFSLFLVSIGILPVILPIILDKLGKLPK